VNLLSATTVKTVKTFFSTAGQNQRLMHNRQRMCSPAFKQTLDANRPGNGSDVFGGPTVTDTSGTVASNQGMLPSSVSMQTPMGTVHNMHPIGQLQSNPQLFQPNQQTLNGFKSGLGAMKIIK